MPLNNRTKSNTGFPARFCSNYPHNPFGGCGERFSRYALFVYFTANVHRQSARDCFKSGATPPRVRTFAASHVMTSTALAPSCPSSVAKLWLWPSAHHYFAGGTNQPPLTAALNNGGCLARTSNFLARACNNIFCTVGGNSFMEVCVPVCQPFKNPMMSLI